MHHTSSRTRLMASAHPVIQPWDYVRLRREAAGVSIEQAASHYWHDPAQREQVEAIIRQQEEVGYQPTANFAAEDMGRAYPFNLTVYEQLCTLPAHQHPRLCTGCGWDQWTSQTDLFGNESSWARLDPPGCTRCEQIARRNLPKGAC